MAITRECCEQYWTSPGGNTPQGTNYTATCLSSWKLSKLDETDMQDTARESGTSSCDVLLWTPTYGRAKAGRPARTYIQQLCEDTGCSPEDLPEAMNNREKWRESIRDIRASGTTWWWYDIKYSYLIQIINTKLYSFKYLTIIIFSKQYKFQVIILNVFDFVNFHSTALLTVLLTMSTVFRVLV